MCHSKDCDILYKKNLMKIIDIYNLVTNKSLLLYNSILYLDLDIATKLPRKSIPNHKRICTKLD